MRRTIEDARRVLEEDLAPALNDGHLRMAHEHLQRAETHARSVAGEYLNRQEAEVREARTEAIVTDEEDWPRHLYARLGFDQIGRTWKFLRSPDRGAGVV